MWTIYVEELSLQTTAGNVGEWSKVMDAYSDSMMLDIVYVTTVTML